MRKIYEKDRRGAVYGSISKASIQSHVGPYDVGHGVISVKGQPSGRPLFILSFDFVYWFWCCGIMQVVLFKKTVESNVVSMSRLFLTPLRRLILECKYGCCMLRGWCSVLVGNCPVYVH